ENLLKEKDFNVARAPFGYYKTFEIKCKGHPLSELSRTILPEEVAEKEEEEKAPSEYLVLAHEGEEHFLKLDKIEDCKILDKYPLLKQFILSEELGIRPGEEPSHIKLMRKLELVDYEPASDVGHFRFYPNGTLIKTLLEELALEIAASLGASRIETPLLYRFDEPDIREQALKFHQKDYKLKLPNRTLLLRFAGDFGLFRMMKDVVMSYKQMPVRIFEISPSFRLEQSGECVGLKRLRAFTMPDVHCFCKDLNEALKEYEILFLSYNKIVNAMQIEYVVAFRLVKEFYQKNKHYILKLLGEIKKPALIELLPKAKHYWIMKHEFQEVDSVGGNAQLSTVQLDIEDSERYGILYVDENGEKKGCIILHSSMGSIERWIYAMLEEATKKAKKGVAPMLPLWLAPTQVRLIPVKDEYLEYCQKISDKIDRENIRVDIDDRNQTVAKKIRDAERHWVPLIVVIGEKEINTNQLPVRIRETRELKTFGIEELISEIKRKTENMPFRALALPKLLSKRPIFISS
ncbi:MAG: threonine--tRNA ligase, partial [Euryarchaeota archaeon]|nr:threonine--tRNA ligase [Euryarchaeota archaeon]